jgi:hypothetical protein
MQTLLKVVAAALFVLQTWAVPGAYAGSEPPSPSRQKIVLHGLYTNSCEPTIDPDGTAVLDEAARLLEGARSGAVLVIDASQNRSDPTRLQRGAEAASIYLAQHGVDLARVRVEAMDEVTPIALCALREPMCPVC